MQTIQSSTDSTDRSKKRICVVPTCRGERFDLVHKFPMENDRTLQWLNALQIPDLYEIAFDKLRTSCFVCSRHFRERDYKNPVSRCLNKTAVPCINLKSLDQMGLVLHRSHPRPLHLDKQNQSQQQHQQQLINYIKPIPIQQKSLKRSYSASCNNANYYLNEDMNDEDIENDGNDAANYGNDVNGDEPASKLSNLIALNSQQFTLFYTKDHLDRLSSSEVGDFAAQLIIEGEEISADVEDVENNEAVAAAVKVGEKKKIIARINQNDNNYDESSLLNDDDDDDSLLATTITKPAVVEAATSTVVVVAAAVTTTNHQQDDECSAGQFVSMTSKFLKVKHPKHMETLSLDYFWLRDHCRCALCFNYDTKQRHYNLLDIHLDVKPSSTDFKDENLLIVKWDDEHESEYDIDFLYQSQFDYMKKNYLTKQILWDRKKFAVNEHQLNYARVDFGQLVTDDNLVEKILKSLITYGVSLIENVPANLDMTEMAIRRLFPIQKTFFGEMWTFSDTENRGNHLDTAYTKEYLEAHTDNTYFCDPAGLQIFHCLEHTNGSGGETFLVDGFKIIQDLMKQNYDAYQKLVEVNLPAEYIEKGRHHTYSAPIISLNFDTKKPERIRFNLYDRAVLNTLPQNEMHEFYEHLRYFAKLLQNKENQWKFKLNPGTILIFDNWRVLHGRESYTGKRKMCGCYVSRTEYLSKARTLGLIR